MARAEDNGKSQRLAFIAGCAGEIAFLGYLIAGGLALFGKDRVPWSLQVLVGALVVVPTLVATVSMVLNFTSRFLKYFSLTLLGIIVLIVTTALGPMLFREASAQSHDQAFRKAVPKNIASHDPQTLTLKYQAIEEKVPLYTLRFENHGATDLVDCRCVINSRYSTKLSTLSFGRGVESASASIPAGGSFEFRLDENSGVRRLFIDSTSQSLPGDASIHTIGLNCRSQVMTWGLE